MFGKIQVQFFRKFTAIFTEISGKFPAEVSRNFPTHNPNLNEYTRQKTSNFDY